MTSDDRFGWGAGDRGFGSDGRDTPDGGYGSDGFGAGGGFGSGRDFGSEGGFGPDDVEQLTAQLDEATAAARNAYRDAARLIRLLTVLSDPSSPDELLRRALTVLSEVFNADVVAVMSALKEGFLVTFAVGLPEGDPSYADSWALGELAAKAMETGRPVTAPVGPDGADVPPTLAGLGLVTAAFVPMSDAELLVLYRSTAEPFSGTDLHVLASVAVRLRIAAEDRERAVAIEYLAKAGALLAPNLEADELMAVAVKVMRQLTMSDDAWIVAITDGTAYQRAHDGTAPAHAGSMIARPVTELEAWPAALRGQAWTATAQPWHGTAPRTALCIPVLHDGRPFILLYASRDRPRPFAGEVVEIATIFSRYFATALENSGLYEELRRQATRDSLTGLANRELARDRLDEVLAANLVSPGAPPFVGLLFCDLDGFKAVNDRLGHEAGDALLQQVALRLQQGLRSTDLLARFGGDEFVAVLSDIDSLTDVTDVGRRLVAALTEPFALDGEEVTVSASIGGVLGVRGQAKASAMLRDADAAMYVAKARGPGVVEVFDDAASHRSLDRLGLRSALLRALDGNEFEVRYQPIVDLRTGRVAGFEALLRWSHADRGMIPPDVFIPIAEETGAIVPIDRWVLHEAARTLTTWQRLPGWRTLNMSVNLSPVQLRQSDVATFLPALLDSVRVDPDDVWLEVTERSHVGADVETATAELRAAGFHFALDDFGSSYSNLAYLKQFPAERLKIDKSFISGVAREGVDRSIVRAIIAMSDALGLRVIAEGVEREDQRAALLELGCRLGQGYLFAPALSVEQGTRLLTESDGRLPQPS
ncbi:putative bifunctional diguanylate cyclase/phosphodiesterase [Hamadaea tsunoensis]|uniref:putative bifunctional diguanylate cyclase/phosphodiesterase n=1 Tax=Hamadaea tsunoensis TaxID=53368 RepID=UPI00040F8E4D|nr:EAL domain-containing protein [Hamadaea tsunoensis]